MFPTLIGDEQLTDGDITGDEELAIIIEGEPIDNGLNDDMSNELTDVDFGEGNAEPVEAYKGLISSRLCAKKQTFLAQPVSSLQSLVLY